ncbi:MAG: DUF4358 domain-containing protein [Angelakisella sp.]
MRLKKITKTAMAVALLTAVLLSGCASKGGNPDSDASSGSKPAASASKAVDPAALAKQMVEALASPVEMTVAEKSAIDNYYGLDTAALDGYCIYMNSSFEAAEIALVGPKADQKDAVKKLLEQRLEQMKESFIDYKPEVYQTVKDNAKILEQNNLLCLISGSAAEVTAAEKVFTDALK